MQGHTAVGDHGLSQPKQPWGAAPVVGGGSGVLVMKVSEAEEEKLRGAPSLSEACSYYRHSSTETTGVALPEHPEPLLGNVALLCSSGAGRGPAGPNGSLEFCLD